MPIHLEFARSFEDYLHAQELHTRRNWPSRLKMIFTLIVAPAFGALIVAFGLLIFKSHTNGVSFILMMGCGLFLMASPLDMRWRIRRHFKRTSIGNGLRSFDFSETQIVAQEGDCKTEIAWSAVNSLVEDETVFLLYLAPAKFMVIPKHACPGESADQLRSMVQEKMREHKKTQATA